MYLKRLELQGFKSFADKTVLEFMPGITSVIGPNGSGKSNISDAIRWVLGEQSMKSLRSGKSSDVIFAGTQNRKSLGFAEASLIFDNSDGKLPIEYTEVTVTRKIYRSGETGYYINKVPCRLKDVLELFMDTGIGKDGYSIIGQGKIDEILSNKSEDRRNVFEEAAGIVKFKTRKEESEKKLEHTKLNLLRINDILTEIEANIEPLKIQADKARKFLNLKEELKNIEVGLFYFNIEKYKSELKEIIENTEILQSNCNLEEGKIERIKLLKEELKDNLDEITIKIENTQNIGFESEKQIEKLNSDINVAKAKIQNNSENIESYNKEISETNEKIKKSKQEIDEKIDKKNSLKENRKKFENELNEKQEKLDEILKNLSDEQLHIESLKRKLEDNIDEKYEIESDTNTQNANTSNIEKRRTQIDNEINSNISELDNTSFKKEESVKEFEKSKKDRNEIQEKIQNILKEKQSIEKEIKIYDLKINNLMQENQIKDSRCKFLEETEREKEGYIKSVKSILNDKNLLANMNGKVHGAVANLITVPKNMQIAIEMSLGASLQNIVINSEEDAKKLIDYLRKNNLGRASFLPISSVKGKKIEKIKKIDKAIGVASDLIEYDKLYENIILSLLGRTVIVENMDLGVELAKENNYSFKIVTLQGDIINPSGAISGGSVPKRTTSILGREKEIEELKEEIKSIKKKIESVQKEQQEKKAILNNMGLKELESESQTIDIKYNVEKQKLESINENAEKLRLHIAKLKQEKINLNAQKEEIQKFIEQNKIKLEKIKRENEELQKEISNYTEKNKEINKVVDDLDFDITNLKISVSSFDESENSINEIQNLIEKEIENNNLNIKNKKDRIQNLTQEIEKLNTEINKNNEKIKEIKEKVSNSSIDIEKLKQEKTNISERIKKQEELQEEEFKIIEDLKAQIVRIDIKKNKTEEDLNSLVNNLWEEYELTPNAKGNYKRPENVALTQKRVNNLRQDIRDLGSVNVDSIEEYKNLKNRYDFMCEQRLDLENTMSKLRNMISDITETMKKQFKERFEIINRNFGEVFKELFGGGKAEIALEDESNILECGININVQPPGKKLQSMMLLSGGERAFTAIALLFAILKMSPAPFCVLDEIEAALDDVNVYRYAEFLKKFSKDTQFLVITHRKGTMEAADTVYGITMEENGISKLLSMKL